MRKWINLFEVKLRDGYWSAVTSTDLEALVAQHGDLRGVAFDNEVFIGPALHEYHAGIRNAVGVPSLYGVSGNESPIGIDFYVAPIEAHYEHEDGDGFEGRNDWAVNSPPLFTVGRVAIWASEDKQTCLQNRQFARMVGSLTEEWHTTLPSSEGDHTYDVFKNPTKAEVFKLLAQSKHHEARALVTPTDIYVWNADADIHLGPMTELGFRYDEDAVRILLDRDGPYTNQFDEMNWEEEQKPLLSRVQQWCTDHPGLRRIYGPNYKLGCR